MLNELFPGILGEYDENLIKQIKLTEKIVPDAVKWNVATTAFMASNNWALAGNRTNSGSPILANDPHLEINRLPAVWYEVAVELADKHTHSATMPGLPSFLLGRSKDLAWGATYAFMDATDSWIEQCKDGKYLKEGEWYKFKERKEIIKRKKKEAIEIVFYENEHGVLDGNPYEEGYYLCTKWSGEKSGANSLKASFQLWDASNVEEGMKAAAQIESAFSWVFADTKGNIGYQMSGLMPKRKKNTSGFTPQKGWHVENDWKGFHDAKDLPQEYNPEKGYIITANNDLNHLGNVSPINIPMGNYRAERIKTLIEEKENIDVSYNKKMHFDTHSIQASLFMEIIKPLLPDSENGQLLRDWGPLL